MEAENLVTHRRVAIKMLRPDLARNPLEVARFLRRARCLAMLHGENVTGVWDIGYLDDGAPFMVLERLEGMTLAKVLETSGPLPIEDAVDDILQICEVIAKAHAHGIVHRDLQPAKLFLTRRADGTPWVVVLDFAIASVASEGGPDLAGQSKSRSPVDARSDIYSLGVSLYQLLTGAFPFEGSTDAEVMKAVLLAKPRPARELRPDLPESLVAVIEKAFARDPDMRYQTAAEFMTALAPFGSTRERG